MQNTKINGVVSAQYYMNKILKVYSLESDMQYFDIIVDSVINGQRTQAKSQFKAMPTEHRKTFVKYIYSDLGEVLSQQDKEIFINQL